MRYIVLKSNINYNEILERKRYIEKVFKIYVIPCRKDNYVEFISIPNNSLDLIIIVGHNSNVYSYLKNKLPFEKNIVLITCFIGDVTSLKFKRKHVYISKNNNGWTDTFDGSEWNINFDITDSELTLYNNKDNELSLKLEKSFERIK